jgi:sugar phosphate isomerase/epimerase
VAPHPLGLLESPIDQKEEAKMKTSLSIWSVHKYVYNKTIDNSSFIDFVATTGAKGVELLSVFWEEGDAERVKEALERNNLKLACFGACNNLAVSDPVKRREQVRDITESVDRAALFGAKVVRVFSGDKEADITYDQAKAWIIEGLREAAKYAESKGIVLCLENHGHFAGKAEQVTEVIGEVGSFALRSTFDTGNFLLVDENPNDAIVKLMPYISHVHFKDFSIADESFEGKTYTSNAGVHYTGEVPGEGIVDLPRLLGELSISGYDGWLTVEYEGNEEQKEGSIRSIRNLEHILNGLRERHA